MSYLKAGTPILYNGGEEGIEEGFVVACWFDEVIEAYDCYVVFLGRVDPQGKPEGVPYVLRFATTSLTVMPPIDDHD